MMKFSGTIGYLGMMTAGTAFTSVMSLVAMVIPGPAISMDANIRPPNRTTQAVAAVDLPEAVADAVIEVAKGWTHAAPGLGQFEGTFTGPDDAYGVNYACAAGYSQVGFRAKGMHVAAGESTITVDGLLVSSGNTTYNSKWDGTIYSGKVESEWGDQLKDAHNVLITAMARGNEAVWTTPSGAEFKIELTGSGGIKNCIVE